MFNSTDGGVPWDDLRKILPGCQRVAKVPNGIEILPKISIAWVGCTSVTDRQTTDGRAMTYTSEFTFAKTACKTVNWYWMEQDKGLKALMFFYCMWPPSTFLISVDTSWNYNYSFNYRYWSRPIRWWISVVFYRSRKPFCCKYEHSLYDSTDTRTSKNVWTANYY